MPLLACRWVMGLVVHAGWRIVLPSFPCFFLPLFYFSFVLFFLCLFLFSFRWVFLFVVTAPFLLLEGW